jgi:glucose-6-phosphate 1-epimerase
VHRVTFGSELRLELICRNTGTTPFRFEEALHTYNRIADIQDASVQGLDGVSYLDNTDSNKQKMQRGDVIIASPTDSAYCNNQNEVDLLDAGKKRRIRLQKENSLTTVVWNPWSEGAARLKDLGDGEWRQFLCVEASNILDAAIQLAPGQEHRIAAVLTVEKL